MTFRWHILFYFRYFHNCRRILLLTFSSLLAAVIRRYRLCRFRLCGLLRMINIFIWSWIHLIIHRLGHSERCSLIWVKLLDLFPTLDSILVRSRIQPILLVKDVISLFEVSFDNSTWDSILVNHWLLKLFHVHVQILAIFCRLYTVLKHGFDFGDTARASFVRSKLLRIHFWGRQRVPICYFLLICLF